MLRYLDPPYALWSIWRHLPRCSTGLVYTLCVLCLYAGFCVLSTISRLHSIKHLRMEDPAARRTVVVIRNRCANLRYAILAEFYLFGIVLFMAFQFVAHFIMGNDLQGQIIGTVVLDSAFATNVLAILLDPASGSVGPLQQEQHLLRAPAWRAINSQFGVTLPLRSLTLAGVF
jgi:hypothetical protein